MNSTRESSATETPSDPPEVREVRFPYPGFHIFSLVVLSCLAFAYSYYTMDSLRTLAEAAPLDPDAYNLVRGMFALTICLAVAVAISVLTRSRLRLVLGQDGVTLTRWRLGTQTRHIAYEDLTVTIAADFRRTWRLELASATERWKLPLPHAIMDGKSLETPLTARSARKHALVQALAEHVGERLNIED